MKRRDGKDDYVNSGSLLKCFSILLHYLKVRSLRKLLTPLKRKCLNWKLKKMQMELVTINLRMPDLLLCKLLPVRRQLVLVFNVGPL